METTGRVEARQTKGLARAQGFTPARIKRLGRLSSGWRPLSTVQYSNTVDGINPVLPIIRNIP